MPDGFMQPSILMVALVIITSFWAIVMYGRMNNMKNKSGKWIFFDIVLLVFIDCNIFFCL